MNIPILLSLASLSISAPSDTYIHVCPIEKEPIIKIYLYHSLRKIEIIHKDDERIIVKLSSGSDDTIFVITRNYIAELRNVINVYVLKNYEEFELDKLTFDIDMEEKCYDNDCDARFYLKIQETE